MDGKFRWLMIGWAPVSSPAGRFRFVKTVIFCSFKLFALLKPDQISFAKLKEQIWIPAERMKSMKRVSIIADRSVSNVNKALFKTLNTFKSGGIISDFQVFCSNVWNQMSSKNSFCLSILTSKRSNLKIMYDGILTSFIRKCFSVLF